MYISVDMGGAHRPVKVDSLEVIDRRPVNRLFGMSLLNSTKDMTVEILLQRAIDRAPTVASFINAHCVNVAMSNKAYAAALERSDLLLPDGSGVNLAARLVGEDLGENLNGTDLFPLLCERAAALGQSLYLLGGEPGVAAEAGRRMQARFPGLRIVGARHGYFRPADEPELLEDIRRTGAGLLLVGLGVPRQETWIDSHRHKLGTPVILGVGGLFDYYSGRIPRAPQAMRDLGCEWVWRLCQEPRRLARRYLAGNGAFLLRAVAAAGARLMGLDNGAATAKRVMDVAVSGAALLFMAPVFAAIAVAIRLDDKGPVLFRQTRVGENGRPFTMLKFRSMSVDAESRRQALLASSERDATCFKMKRDPRVTWVGAILRRTSLDELPQLINVLRGDMSMVGPRPALPVEVATYRGLSWARLHGKPGLTCTWQVSGRAEIPFAQQVKMDVAYLRRQSAWADLVLLARTVPAVLSGRGAY